MRVLWTARIGRIGPAASVGHHDPLLHVAPMSHELAGSVCLGGAGAPPGIPTRAEAARLLIMRGIEADKAKATAGEAKPAAEAPARKR